MEQLYIKKLSHMLEFKDAGGIVYQTSIDNLMRLIKGEIHFIYADSKEVNERRLIKNFVKEDKAKLRKKELGLI